MGNIAGTECLCRRMARGLAVGDDRRDLIDIPSVRLAMRGLVDNAIGKARYTLGLG